MSIPADEKPGDTIRRSVAELRTPIGGHIRLRLLDDITAAAHALEEEANQLADALQEELDRQHDDGSHW